MMNISQQNSDNYREILTTLLEDIIREPQMERLQEASQKGRQSLTIEYLNRHQLVTIIIFIIVIVGGVLWSEFIITLISKHIFMVPRQDLTAWMWLISALLVTTITWVLLRYVFRIPITAAYCL
jgi:hypothetical protein